MNHSCAPKKTLKLPYLPFPWQEKENRAEQRDMKTILDTIPRKLSLINAFQHIISDPEDQ
jgi:hypothetical protein